MEANSKQNDRLKELLHKTVKANAAKSDGACAWTPVGDLKKTTSSYTLYVDLPGLDEDELKIHYQDGVLTIAGERDFDHDKEDAEEFTRIDRPYGTFRYSVTLDDLVDYEMMSAKYKRGVLKVVVPRCQIAHNKFPLNS